MSAQTNLTQLIERLLPIPEVWSSNPVVGKKFIMNISTVIVEKTK